MYGYSVACVAVGEKETDRRVQRHQQPTSRLSPLSIASSAKAQKAAEPKSIEYIALRSAALLHSPVRFIFTKALTNHIPPIQQSKKSTLKRAPKLHIKSCL